MMSSLSAPVQSPRKLRSLGATHPAPQTKLLWWVEINTSVPTCTYFFGPFGSRKEAQEARTGYVEDLYQEEARGIIARVRQCQPNGLTLDQGYYSTEALVE